VGRLIKVAAAVAAEFAGDTYGIWTSPWLLLLRQRRLINACSQRARIIIIIIIISVPRHQRTEETDVPKQHCRSTQREPATDSLRDADLPSPAENIDKSAR